MSQKYYIECSWGEIHIVEFNKNSSPPIICLHGWLDNWASFQPVSKYFKEHLICIDLPGHGRSSHLPDGNWYHFIDYAVRLREIINKLKLRDFHILGHSMGAAVGCIYAAAFPESVLSLIMIDGLGPLVNQPEEARDILRNSILNREQKKNTRKPFTDLDLAIKARMSSGGIEKSAAKLLVENQINKFENSYEWSFDYKLKFMSSLRLTQEQLGSFFENIQCPALLIKATEGYVKQAPYWKLRDKIKSLQVNEVSGNHHLHMEKASEIYDVIIKFLKETKHA